MHRLVGFGSLVLFTAFATTALTPRPPAGPGAIKDMLEGMFRAIDAGDRPAAKACLADDCPYPVQIYDMDPANQPVAIEGVDAARKYLDSLFDALAKDHMQVASKITKIHPDCNSPDLGYATLEFTQTFTAGDKTGTSSYRATALVHWGKDQSKGPKIFHWHS
jgi:hypothetical protein